MRTMKKWIALIACAIVLLTGCASSSTETYTKEQPETQTECQHKKWSAETCVELSTCKSCGITRGHLAEHSFSLKDGTCIERKICRVCGAEGDFGDHSFVGGDCANPSVCEYCGEQGSLGDHKYDREQTCLEGCSCLVCGNALEPLGHDMQEATCEKESTCRRCGYAEGQALGHDGYGLCKRCGNQVPISGSGHGDGVISGITLADGGIYALNMTHNGTSNFIVHSFDASGDEEYLINEIGNYAGAVLFMGQSPMMINIEADGDWTFEVTAIQKTNDVSFAGSGDYITGLFSGAKGARIWHFKHDGSSNFVVWIYTTDGCDLIVNEIGVYDADQVVTVPDGFAFFEITADGNWEVYLEQGE